VTSIQAWRMLSSKAADDTVPKGAATVSSVHYSIATLCGSALLRLCRRAVIRLGPATVMRCGCPVVVLWYVITVLPFCGYISERYNRSTLLAFYCPIF
jgi:hypothetical protein